MVSFNDVAKLYVATFNRAPDTAGLNYWVYSSGLTIEEIAQSFFDQPETQVLYPVGTSDSNFVNSVYNNLFNRAAEQAGLDYWVTQLNSGNVSKQNFILAVINGAQNTALGNDAIILTNKQTVALSFVQNGLDDVELAKTVIEGIDDSDASVSAATTLISAVVSPVGTITSQAIAGTTIYTYVSDASDSSFSDGQDAGYRIIFNQDGTVTHTKLYAQMGALAWTSEEVSTTPERWSVENGRLIVRSSDAYGSYEDTLTLVSQNGSQAIYNDASVTKDSAGNVIWQDNSSVVSSTLPLTPRSESEIISSLGLVKETFSGQIRFEDANGNVVSSPADAKVTLTFDHSSVSDINGISVNADGTFSAIIYTVGDLLQSNEPIGLSVYADQNGDGESTYLRANTFLNEMQFHFPTVTVVNGGSYYSADGVSAWGDVNYEVSVTASSANVSTMLGSKVDTAFIINIFDTTAAQTITGTRANDYLNWRGGNDTFDGAGGTWDVVGINLNPVSSNSIAINTSVTNVITIRDNASVLATLTKNLDNSVDIVANGYTLHTTNVENFRPLIVPQDGSASYNITIDLVGNQTGTFDAHF